MSRSRPIFSAPSLRRSWSAADVMHWALVCGGLEPAWRQFLRGEAAKTSAEALNREADSEAMQELSEAFRYNRDLITVEETERWFEARDLDTDAFVEYLERRYWLQNSGEKNLSNELFVSATAELKEKLRVELWLTGEMDRLAQALSHRVVSQDQQQANPRDTAEAMVSEQSRFLERHNLLEGEIADWLRALGRNQDWLEEQFRFEAAFHRTCAAALTSEARQSILRAQRLSLLQIRLEIMRFENLDAAREAALCVHESGESVAKFAAECGQPFEEMSFLLGNASAEDQSRLLSLTPGELVGPEQVEKGFQICRLAAKEEPSLDNPEVAAAIDERILDAHFAGLSAGVVHWELAEAIHA
jgi:hypothetical protein